MNTRRLAALALVTLATLGTACDTEPTPSATAALELRDGEGIDPPTRPTTGSFTVKGGHDNPFEYFGVSFRDLPLEVRLAFFKDMHKQAVDAIEDEFLSDERNVEACPKACGDVGMAWNEGATVRFVHVEHGEVSVAEDEHGPHWAAEALATGEASCGCVAP